MIRVRQANRKDAAVISELIVPVAKAQIAAEFSPEGEQELLSGMTPSAIEQNLLQGYRYFLAADDGRYCGVIGMRGYTYIYHLFVAEKWQRRGIARRLWARARQASMAEIRLSEFNVFSSRYAEGFYHRLGFRRTGNEQTRKGVTAIPMRLVIDG